MSDFYKPISGGHGPSDKPITWAEGFAEQAKRLREADYPYICVGCGGKFMFASSVDQRDDGKYICHEKCGGLGG
jgi:predicted SprT family Zn-dependent metalloprotease